MGHLRDAADRLRVPQRSPPPPPPPPPPTTTTTTKPESLPAEVDSEPELKAPPPPPPPPPLLPMAQPQADGAARPWNLRQRTRRRPAASMSWAAAVPVPSSSRRRKRAPFSVALTPEEIEEDIYALTGSRPRRRPRKRPRVVQRQLDSLFPGLWLTEVTADAYRVPDE
uniref:DUF1639 family protein n=1 Tax=Oryza nivara TaxID=4536 RepID=A0A0E0HHU5_ORYNI